MKLKCRARRLFKRRAPLDWISITNTNAGTVSTCRHCGAYLHIALPVSVELWKMAQATFLIEHENCQNKKGNSHAHQNQNPAKTKKHYC